MSMEDKRFRRRTWNRTKSTQHLPKYTSQPELQLLPQGRHRFQCQQCGFINTLFPLCLCCSWASQEAGHEFDPAVTRARRASAPAGFLELKVRIEEENATDPHDQRRRRRLMVSKSTGCFPLSVGIREEEETMVTSKHLSNGGQNGDALSSAIAFSEPVATATHSLSSLVFARAQTTSQAAEVPPSSLNIERDTSDLLPQSIPSEEQPTSSVDRPTPIMPPIRSSRNLRVKRSHQLLLIDIHDTKMLPSHSSDDEDLLLKNSLDQDHRKPFLDKDQQQRTIRRRKHLNIMQTSVAKSDSIEPIAIALNLHTPSSSTDLDSKPTEPSHRLSAGISPQAATSESGNGDPTTPLTPPLLTPPPPSTDPTGLSAYSPGSSPGSSPVRLGHPSRPYYSAIRKNGISPPPSRPSSVSGPSPTSSPRPQSYTPPSTFPTSGPNSTTASRHLSMSAMFVSPPYSSPPGVFSAFSVMDDADTEDEDDDNMPVLPPTPAPGRTRFSLSSSDRRFLHGPLLSTPTGATPKHNHSQSLSQARSKGLRGSVGFSMSGETELRMALAIGAADSGVPESGFRFRETVVSPPPMSVDTEAQPRVIRNSFMGRVKKLRQGLKDLLFMTSTTSTTTTTA